MSKESFYFSHDCNARNDEKILAVRMRLKAEGYGAYFMIIERLLESTNYMSVKDYNIIAFDLRVGADLVKSLVENFGLFVFTDCGKYFYSESLLNRMKPLNNLREQRSLAGKKSAEIRAKKANENQEVTTNVERPLNEKETKESKVKESKVKESIENIIEGSPIGDKSKPFTKISENEFYDSLKPFIKDFDKSIIREFYDYWREPTADNKMRFQKEKAWDVKRRLYYWKNRESKFNIIEKSTIKTKRNEL